MADNMTLKIGGRLKSISEETQKAVEEALKDGIAVIL